jgi:hypothetical protein
MGGPFTGSEEFHQGGTMRTLLIAAATVGVLLTAPAMAAPAGAPAPQTQATTDQATVQDFSARRHHRYWRHRHHWRHYGWYRGHHWGWRHRHHRHYWR